MEIGKSDGLFGAAGYGQAVGATNSAGNTGNSAAFAEAMRGVYEQTGYRFAATAPVLNNPLSPAAWPDKFSARIDAAAEKLGISVDDVKAKFAAISQRAAEEGGFEQPKEFLKSLSEEDRATITAVQSYGVELTDSRIGGLGQEGALNLLLPPGAQRDFNGDGFHQIGEGNIFSFPPDSASPKMKQAWDSYMQEIPEEDRLMAVSRFLPLIATENLEYDGQGQATGMRGPRDVGFRNPYAEPDFSFMDYAQDRLAFVEANPHMVDSRHVDSLKRFWSGLIDKFQEHGVA
ncbi:MAG: hypothetical protein HWE08_14775 [Alphaproteobacteria bacterium]|nr:hypothetical protein [Alphaproteobacteria bacterium]